uniref:Tetraspanin n=1 Tax=Leptobrachium leishanense TaxID=445787 RepID=A0A8C5P750_9ANUR
HGMKCVKYLMFIFNFIFWICGIALIALGIYVQVQLNHSILIKNASSSGASIVIIAVGVVISFISFFGCCGAVKENYCMVTTFAVILVLIFLVEITAAIAGYVLKDKILLIDVAQRDFGCCGANNYTDWTTNGPFKDKTHVLDSCSSIHTNGCVEEIYAKIKSNIGIIAGVALGIAFFEILGIIFACYLSQISLAQLDWCIHWKPGSPCSATLTVV